jgi:hypothetical protein
VKIFFSNATIKKLNKQIMGQAAISGEESRTERTFNQYFLMEVKGATRAVLLKDYDVLALGSNQFKTTDSWNTVNSKMKEQAERMIKMLCDELSHPKLTTQFTVSTYFNPIDNSNVNAYTTVNLIVEGLEDSFGETLEEIQRDTIKNLLQFEGETADAVFECERDEILKIKDSDQKVALRYLADSVKCNDGLGSKFSRRTKRRMAAAAAAAAALSAGAAGAAGAAYYRKRNRDRKSS